MFNSCLDALSSSCPADLSGAGSVVVLVVVVVVVAAAEDVVTLVRATVTLVKADVDIGALCMCKKVL
jgi:hypothetical protein